VVHLYKKQRKNGSRVGEECLTVTSRVAHEVKRSIPLARERCSRWQVSGRLPQVPSLTMLQRSKTARVLCALICMATPSRTPGLTVF
jgi:hypothetical protein